MNQAITPLWDFSLALYAQPQVAEICLFLQDNHGINVNMLLWCYWLEYHDIRLDPQRLLAAYEHIGPWETDVVKPLRELRRAIKVRYDTLDPGIENLRQRIKQAELLAEQQTQLRLEALAQPWEHNLLTAPAKSLNARIQLTTLSVPVALIEKTVAIFEASDFG